jgi:two-component system chemotaxis sensor kinase CheA
VAGAGGEHQKSGGSAGQSQTVRVDVARLDSLLNLVGELVIDQTRIAQLTARIAGDTSGNAAVESLHEAAAHFGRITGELQEEIMKARMLPIDHVFNRFPRMIRDLAQKLDKEIDFVVSGRETELDRSVIEVIGDPLIHLLRNSVDHGIEPAAEREAAGKPRKGTVWLRARHEENYIVIEIEDDGRGIDPSKIRDAAVGRGQLTADAAARMTDKEALNLVFASGFSTAQQVTDVSGRGVGMDIVKNNLTRFGALINLESSVGKGTKFTIKLPLTLAIIKGLLVSVPAGVYVLPLSAVVETIRVAGASIHVVNGREVIVQRGSTIPLVRLDDVFWRDTAGGAFTRSRAMADDDSRFVVIIGIGERRFGLVVHSLLGEQEIVIKSLGKLIGDVRGISGATILGDGRIALIVDASGLLGIAVDTRETACAA